MYPTLKCLQRTNQKSGLGRFPIHLALHPPLQWKSSLGSRSDVFFGIPFEQVSLKYTSMASLAYTQTWAFHHSDGQVVHRKMSKSSNCRVWGSVEGRLVSKSVIYEPCRQQNTSTPMTRITRFAGKLPQLAIKDWHHLTCMYILIFGLFLFFKFPSLYIFFKSVLKVVHESDHAVILCFFFV